MYVRIMSGTAVPEAMTALLGAYDAVAACGLEDLPVSELLAFIDGLEALACQLPTQSHRALARLQYRDHGQGTGRQVVEGRAGDPVAPHHERSQPPAPRSVRAGTATGVDRSALACAAARSGRLRRPVG